MNAQIFSSFKTSENIMSLDNTVEEDPSFENGYLVSLTFSCDICIVVEGTFSTT